jgi:hypothetical protein
LRAVPKSATFALPNSVSSNTFAVCGKCECGNIARVKSER